MDANSGTTCHSMSAVWFPCHPLSINAHIMYAQHTWAIEILGAGFYQLPGALQMDFHDGAVHPQA